MGFDSEEALYYKNCVIKGEFYKDILEKYHFMVIFL